MIEIKQEGFINMNKQEYAIKCFDSGFNCAQSVFSAFCEDYGLEKSQALKIACSFGAGMGYLDEVCGAVSGAFMVLGLIYGQNDEKDAQKKALTYLKVKEFAKRFREINGTINCSELLNCSLGDETQLKAARQTGLFREKCPQYIRDAVAILEEMIAEK
jgi:C_GCAxxG_C_C family probable redox protein